MPEDLREACRIGRLNLLEVPLEVSFASISREVGAMLQAAGPETGTERAGDEETLVLQQLTRAAAKDNQGAIMRALASILRGRCLCGTPQGVRVVGPLRSSDSRNRRRGRRVHRQDPSGRDARSRGGRDR